MLGTKRVSHDQTSVDIVVGVDVHAEENLDEMREEVIWLHYIKILVFTLFKIN